jgi:hypothetical protein
LAGGFFVCFLSRPRTTRHYAGRVIHENWTVPILHFAEWPSSL